MRNENYEMVTVEAFVNNYEAVVTSINEKEIAAQIEKYVIAQRRNETNAKVVEALLA